MGFFFGGGVAESGIVYARNSSNVIINNSTTPQTIISVPLSVGTYLVNLYWGLNGTANTGTKHAYNFTGTPGFIRVVRMRASSMVMVEINNTTFSLGLAETNTSAWIRGLFNITVAGDLELQAAQNSSHADNLTVNTYCYIYGQKIE